MTDFETVEVAENEFSWADELSQVFGRPSKIFHKNLENGHFEGEYEVALFILPDNESQWLALFLAKKENDINQFSSVVIAKPYGEKIELYEEEAALFDVEAFVVNKRKEEVVFEGKNKKQEKVKLVVTKENYHFIAEDR